MFPHRPSPGIAESNCQMSAPSLQYTLVGAFTYAEERRSSSGVFRKLGRVHGGTDTASSERVRVVRAPVLPIVPNLVNHLYNVHVSPSLNKTVGGTYRMVEEEQGVYVGGTVEHTDGSLDTTLTI